MFTTFLVCLLVCLQCRKSNPGPQHESTVILSYIFHAIHRDLKGNKSNKTTMCLKFLYCLPFAKINENVPKGEMHISYINMYTQVRENVKKHI